MIYRRAPDAPPWLRSTPLRDVHGRPLPLAQAMQKAEQLNAELDRWRAKPGHREVRGALDAVLQAYRASREFGKLAPRSRKDYGRHLDALAAAMGDLDPNAITKPGVVLYLDHLQAEEGMDYRSVLYRAAVLRAAWSWAVRRGHVPAANPAAGLGMKLPRSRAGITWPLDVLRTIVAREPYPVGLAVRLALYTTQRFGDIIRMRWSDIEGDRLRVVQGKTGVTLWVPLHPRLVAALAEAPRRGETILAAESGRPFSGTRLRTRWLAVAGDLKGKRTFHDLRGTAISLLSAGGLPDELVMRFTGQKRKGSGAILDAYDARLGELARRAFPVMDGWKL